MKVHDGNWVNCAGTINETIKIKISDEELGTDCVTKAIKFKVVHPPEIIVWNTTDLLSNCTEMKIDPVNNRLEGTAIEGADEIKNCIKFLKVVLDDVPSTTYKKDPESNNLTKNINECWPDNPCGHGTCIDTDGAFNCICDEGWKTIGNETCGKQFKFGKL